MSTETVNSSFSIPVFFFCSLPTLASSFSTVLKTGENGSFHIPGIGKRFSIFSPFKQVPSGKCFEGVLYVLSTFVKSFSRMDIEFLSNVFIDAIT